MVPDLPLWEVGLPVGLAALSASALCAELGHLGLESAAAPTLPDFVVISDVAWMLTCLPASAEADEKPSPGPCLVQPGSEYDRKRARGGTASARYLRADPRSPGPARSPLPPAQVSPAAAGRTSLSAAGWDRALLQPMSFFMHWTRLSPPGCGCW